MKIFFKIILILYIPIIFISCVKNQYNKDIDKIEAYIQSHNLDTLNIDKDDKGIYHIVVEEGTGIYPISNDSVTITFILKLIDDKVVNDENAENPCIVSINGLVPGLASGICKMRTGETAILILPSYLGYGNYSIGDIPSNSVLIYYITLISTKHT